MKNVVIGTAGHIDHGKTALVKKLTGVDTDRLEEEKRRGMTIELGFAPLKLPSGKVVSFIDVPGHEKFIKTMVAGVSGIDAVLLAVAANEGVMPQTKEHIDILSLLNINTGVVALTKADLVDKEWLTLVTEEVKAALKGTTLEGINIIPVSSETGNGIEKLITELENAAEMISANKTGDFFRLPVDRVFTITGYGTVVTGTVTGGNATRGDAVEIQPSGRKARIRGIQVHNNDSDCAPKGERCALNLSGVDKSEVSRGDIVCSEGILKPVRIVDAVLYTVKGKGSIHHNQRVHVNTGTGEYLARVRILGPETINEGSSGYVQLKFEEPVATVRNDRFILRSYSPVDTIGGGWVIFHNTFNRRRLSDRNVHSLEVGEKGDLSEIIGLILDEADKAMSFDEIWRELYEDKNQVWYALENVVKSGNAVHLKKSDKYIGYNVYVNYKEKTNSEFENLYKRYPYRFQIDKEALKSRIFNDFGNKTFVELLEYYIIDNEFVQDGNFVLQTGGTAVDRIFAMKNTSEVENIYLNYSLNPFNIKQEKKVTKISNDDIDEITIFLLKTGRLIELSDGILIHKDALINAVKLTRETIINRGGASVAEIRDLLSSSRKTTVALLEYLDKAEITLRSGDVRKPGVHFMDYYI